MPVLIDTMVLIHAIRPPKATDTAEWREARQRSQHLLAKEKDFRFSAISVLEIERGLRANEQGAWAALLKNINVRPVTGAIAVQAAELLRKKQGPQSTCPRCLNAKASVTCPKCKSFVSVQRNLNDAIIAATADLEEGIDTLYSTDGGVLAFAEFVSGARILGLPSVSGPLFENLPKGPPAATPPAQAKAEPTSPAPKQSKPERP